jgi:hypothetical protein
MSTSNVIDFELDGLPFRPFANMPSRRDPTSLFRRAEPRGGLADSLDTCSSLVTFFSPPKAPQLPPGWIEIQNPDGQTFYYHQQSNTSHWNIPGVPTSDSQRHGHGVGYSGPSFSTLSDLSAEEVSLVVSMCFS